MTKRTKTLLIVPSALLYLAFIVHYLLHHTLADVLNDLGRGGVGGLAFFTVIIVAAKIRAALWRRKNGTVVFTYAKEPP